MEIESNIEKIYTDNKYKHLEMIEAIIERMSRNSFYLKGWAVTLVVLIGSFSAYGSNQRYIVIAFLPIFCFWLLDSYYLQQERRYRFLYKDVQHKEEAEIDFNLDCKELKVNDNDAKTLRYVSCCFSFTEGVFYIPITAGVIFLMVWLFWGGLHSNIYNEAAAILTSVVLNL